MAADSVSHNAKNNGTPAHYESLCHHYALYACPDAVETLAEWLDNNQDSLHAKLGEGAMILDAVGVILWDTESDGVGGTHAFALMREWGFRNLATGETLHLP